VQKVPYHWFLGFASSLAKFSTIPPSPAKITLATSTMSKAADLNKEYESANGSLEKKLGDTEVIANKDEGEESDDYEELDDEVCVLGNITKIWEFNLF
jgi:hypothetical protein